MHHVVFGYQKRTGQLTLDQDAAYGPPRFWHWHPSSSGRCFLLATTMKKVEEVILFSLLTHLSNSLLLVIGDEVFLLSKRALKAGCATSKCLLCSEFRQRLEKPSTLSVTSSSRRRIIREKSDCWTATILLEREDHLFYRKKIQYSVDFSQQYFLSLPWQNLLWLEF